MADGAAAAEAIRVRREAQELRDAQAAAEDATRKQNAAAELSCVARHASFGLKSMFVSSRWLEVEHRAFVVSAVCLVTNLIICGVAGIQGICGTISEFKIRAKGSEVLA